MTDETTIPDGFLIDAKGNLIAEKNVKPTDLLIDQTVQKIVEYADELSERIARFRSHTTDDIDALMETMREQYKATRTRSANGDITLTSFNGLLKVTQQSQDQMDFGPELQIAKDLLDTLIEEWGEGASSEIRTIVQSAFDTSKGGRINRDAILRLRRLEFEDERWPQVQAAIGDSIRSLGRKSYIRIHRRASTEEGWTLIPINLAKAGA